VRTQDADSTTVSATKLHLDEILLEPRWQIKPSFADRVSSSQRRVSTFRVEEDAAGNTLRTNTDSSGLATVTTELFNGNVVTTTPDGTQTTVTKLPDPVPTALTRPGFTSIVKNRAI